jgi:polyisoprenoid-binding protein YceI
MTEGSRKMRTVLFLLPSLLAAQTTTFDIRPTPGSRFALEVYKSKLWEGRKHTFVFDRFRGVLDFDAERTEQSTVSFAVESASARCVDDWVKPHQIKDIEKAAITDTMDAAEYPEITFQSMAIRRTSSDQYEVQGALTIRGKTRPVMLALKASPDQSGMWFEGSSRVKLSDFGLTPPRGVFGVRFVIGTKDEMSVLFRIMASKR